MKKGFKGLYMIIPEIAHTKLKKLSAKKKMSMTDMLLGWIEEE